MREITANPNLVVPLGRQGENQATIVKFPVSGWNELYGDGSFSLLHKRSGDVAPYPVTIEYENGFVIWAVTSADVYYMGYGTAQLMYIVGDAVAKSVMHKTSVLQAIDGGEIPEPTPSWIEEVLEIGEKAEENQHTAEAWAVGKRDGVDVPDTDETYHNNSKWYAGQAGEHAAAAETAQGKAEDAQEAIENLSVSAETVAAGSSASVTKTVDPETGAVNLDFEIPRGDTGYPTDAQVAEATDEWLEENVAQETGYVLDSTLTMSNAAAPADKVGELKTAITQLDSEINVNGKRYFNEDDFARGNIAYATGTVIEGTYRVITPNIQINSEDVTIKSIADGFQCYVGYYSDASGSSLSSGFSLRLAGYVIPKNSYYRMLIRRATENTSEIANVSEFVHKVEISSYLEETYLKKTDAALTYATKSEVSNLVNVLEIDIANLTWEQGTISTSDGTNSASQKWLRTSNYFSYQVGNTLHVKCDSTHKGNVYEYTSVNGSYVYNGSKAFSYSEPFMGNVSDGVYYRFSLTRVNDTNIPTIEAEDVIVYTTKGIFQYDNNVINPEYEILDVPSALLSSGWSDFCIIDGKLWLFKGSADEVHTDTSGKINVYDMTDWSLVKEISHNFGHMNTCSYDATHDILLVGNLPGNTTYPCALYIFYNISSWLDETSLSFSTVDKSIINLRSGGWTTLGNVSATFGENNGAFRNIVYVSLAYGKHLAKLILGMGTNQLTYGGYTAADADKFNGTFKVLKESDSDYELGNNTEWDSQALDEVWQGCDYYKGKILSCNGDKRLATANLWNFRYDNTINREIIGFDIYQDNGEPYRDDTITQSLFPEGIAYDPTSGYIYMGIIYMQSGNRAMHLVRYKI